MARDGICGLRSRHPNGDRGDDGEVPNGDVRWSGALQNCSLS
jgi:hypothetical protein